MTHRVSFTAVASVLAAALSLHATPAAGAADAAGILAKHKAYVGWAYGDGTLKSSRTTVEASMPSPKPDATPDPLGEAGARTVELRRDLLYRASTTAYGIEVRSSGFTGSVFWRSNINGYTVTRRGRDARQGLIEDVIDAEAMGEAPATVRPDQQFDGKTATVLRLEPKTGAPADLYFDSNGALLGYTVQPDIALERYTIHVVSYAEFAPGKRYVSAYRVDTSSRTYHVTNFDPNPTVSDADLHPPSARATWSFGEPNGVPISVLRSLGGGRAVIVQASVNGHVGHFLVDSGASSILIYDPFAKGAGIADLGRTGYVGVNGNGVRATIARIDTLAIGGNTLRNVLVTHSAGGFGSDIDGIIGYDVLAGAVVNVDLTKNRLTIADPAGFDVQPIQGAYAFPVDLTDFHAGVPVKIKDTILPSVWLDTGDDFFVILPHELERHTVALTGTIAVGGTDYAMTIYFGGVDGAGSEPARCVHFNEIQVGPYRYQKALSCFAPNDTFGVDGGLIGFDFLRHFNWTFDYPHGRVVLTPNGA